MPTSTSSFSSAKLSAHSLTTPSTTEPLNVSEETKSDALSNGQLGMLSLSPSKISSSTSTPPPSLGMFFQHNLDFYHHGKVGFFFFFFKK
ncbi:hypothetical protein HMI55_003115 [Coelomomyces lativittatus]|nr:hypothetical protein HMI55_003115 [Coelomomyces lativittatus]